MTGQFPAQHAAVPLLRMRGIRKTFPGTVALAGVDLEVYAGEVHCILGENGAGKSTLMKVLSGSHIPDQGSIEIDGQAVTLQGPVDGLRAGISVIYQELDLFADLTVAQNLFLGHAAGRGGFIASRGRRRAAWEYLNRVGATFTPSARVGELAIADQQLTAIARALTTGARIIVMDEPTATLGEADVSNVYNVIRRLTAENRAVIYISHRLDEIKAIGTRITVLRDGANAAKYRVSESTAQQWVSDMVGQKANSLTQRHTRRVIAENIALDIVKARIPGLIDVRDLQVRAGEILGLAGLGGSGRTTLLWAIFGAIPSELLVRIDGSPIRVRSTRQAIGSGFGLVPENRKTQGLLLNMSVARNAGLASLRGGAFFPRERQQKKTAPVLQQLAVKCAGPRQEVAHLSGGNQQKVVLAKWLARDTRILLLDEPTRGLDIGAKADFYRQVRRLAEDGAAVLVASSELNELMAHADRIAVMYEGEIIADFDPFAHTEAEISHAIIGGRA